ncbi:Uncharacterized protein Adt_18441 [Abeliophyllum distichum]|uniref:TFIIS N-terminal domain-containing protein n=1 Tax=Abeliophyllum distichum TaxID=126358 RepID=A0ABD1TJE8_9LAMI
MTLDDFFSLSEMNNGLTGPARVRELVAVIKKERDSIMKSVEDATRQWNVVARTIAATENKDCLDLFIQLDGLHFIDKWLKDAQTLCNGTSDSFLEESITHLLQALEKLLLDNQKSVSSEIWNTVWNLLGHNSSKLQNTAQALLDGWRNDRDGDTSSVDVDRVGTLTDDGMGISACVNRNILQSESSSGGGPLPQNSSGEEKFLNSTVDFPSTSFDAFQPGKLDNANTSDRNLDATVMNDRPFYHICSPSFSMPENENLCNKVEPTVCGSIGTSSVESCIPAVPTQGSLDRQTDFHNLQLTSDVKQIPNNGSSLEKLDSLENPDLLEDRSYPSNSDAADALNSVTQPNLLKISNGADKDSFQKGSASADARMIDSEEKGDVDDGRCTNRCRSPSASESKEGGQFNTHVSQNTYASEQCWENCKDSSTFLSRIGDVEESNKFDQHVSNLSNDDLANNYDFPRLEMDRGPDQIKRFDVEPCSRIIDPLEVACQVAIEVEREVKEFAERSSSSSQKVSEGKIQEPDISDSISKKHNGEGSPKEVANDQDLSAGISPIAKESATSAENQDAEQMNSEQDLQSCWVTEAVQEAASTEKSPCNFDLNEEVYSDDADCSGNEISIPVSIVSASKAAAAPGLPVSPLQFEGNLGWKGSSATSAFQPASPCRITEGDKELSTGGSSSSSKQRHGCLHIDLNVPGNGDDRTGDQLSDRQVPVSSGSPGKFSAESNSRLERLELDLNNSSEAGDVHSDWRTERQLFPERNDHPVQSHSSSSSSKRSLLTNIDLNGHPSFLNSSDDSHLCNLSQNLNASGGIKLDETAISIMGTRVEVRRKDFVPQFLPLPNGRTPELSFDINLARTESILGMGSALPNAHSTICGYNGLEPAMSLCSTMYGPGGPIPYMMDSRGAPVVPQIVGSASSPPPALSQSFMISMNGSTASNGVGPPRASLDPNSRSMLEGRNRDPAGFGQFLNLNMGQARSTDEQLRSSSQLSISSVGRKRKEPDSGWEHFAFKHYTPPHK